MRWNPKQWLGQLKADSCVVDICITTDYKELEHVCLLAEALAKRKDNTRRIWVSIRTDLIE